MPRQLGATLVIRLHMFSLLVGTASAFSVSEQQSSSIHQQRRQGQQFGPESFCAHALSQASNDDSPTVGDGDYNELYDSPSVLDADESGTGPSIDRVDVAIVGAGIGGLCAGAILNTLYGKKVGVYESHYLPGGCAHAFDRVGRHAQTGEKTVFTFDSGPTIVLGCSQKPFNPLRQVLNAIGRGDEVEWLRNNGWGMVENPGKENEIRWNVELGPSVFEEGPLLRFGGDEALKEFREWQELTKELVTGAVAIPAMAMRAGPTALIPLLRYFKELVNLIQLGPDLTTGTFEAYMDGPRYVVKTKWLRDWLDALAFSLSGLPASRTSAAAMVSDRIYCI